MRLRKVDIEIVPTNDVANIDLDFALNTYKDAFIEYVNVKISNKVLNLDEFPYRITIFGKQYLADLILKAAIQMRRNDVIIVLTSTDIYTTGTNYIFGLATIGSALISSARINPSFWKGFEEIFHYTNKGRVFFEKQFKKVLIHEFGHTLGLPHCNDWNCVMHYSNSPIELYQKGDWFCINCWKELTLQLIGMKSNKE